MNSLFRFWSVTVCLTTMLAVPARADLIGKTTQPSETMTRGGDDSGAQVDSFWSDIGDSFKDVGNAFNDAGKAVGQDFTNFGNDVYHGNVLEAVQDLGNGVAGAGSLATGHTGHTAYRRSLGDGNVDADGKPLTPSQLGGPQTSDEPPHR
jgi:hypothetical protein